jgi:DNA-directed RNA polymerase specialized sigma24 family protein
MVDDLELEALVAGAAARDERAWQSLWAEIGPRLERIVAQPWFLGRLGRRDDDRRDIVVAVMARLRADDFHRLRSYVGARRANPQLRFFTWLRVVAKRVGVDHLRAHPEYIRRDARWIDPVTLPPASQLPGERPPVTERGTARELMAVAMPTAQRRALEMWSRGESFDAIAHALGVPNPERTVRAALERLRRRFRDREEP